jgi:hypothetical protein
LPTPILFLPTRLENEGSQALCTKSQPAAPRFRRSTKVCIAATITSNENKTHGIRDGGLAEFEGIEEEKRLDMARDFPGVLRLD